MRTIAIMNNKGGVGKTVTAINLADILVREHGKRVVLVDCDGQMNLTRFFLPEFDPEINFSMVDLLTGNGEAVWSDNLMPIQPGLDLIPGSSELYELDLDAILGESFNTDRLKEFCAVAAEDEEVDYFIFDCPPGFTSASVAALYAADDVVIPMLVDGFSFIGVEDMEKQITSLRRTRPSIRIAGILITQYHNSRVVYQGEELIRSMGVPVFRQTIRRTVKVPESTFYKMPLCQYGPKSPVAEDYRSWVREYLGGGVGCGV